MTSTSGGEQLPALRARVFTDAGRYRIDINGEYFDHAETFIAATTLLCTQAAQYHRRVYVEHTTKLGSEFMEITPDGTITKTTAPLDHTYDRVARTLRSTTTPHTVNAPTDRASATTAAPSKHRGRRTAARSVTATIAAAAVLAGVCGGTYLWGRAALDAAREDTEKAQQWSSVAPATPQQVRDAARRWGPADHATHLRAVTSGQAGGTLTFEVGAKVATQIDTARGPVAVWSSEVRVSGPAAQVAQWLHADDVAGVTVVDVDSDGDQSTATVLVATPRLR